MVCLIFTEKYDTLIGKRGAEMFYMNLNDYDNVDVLVKKNQGERATFEDAMIEHMEDAETISIVGKQMGFRRVSKGKYICLKAV